MPNWTAILQEIAENYVKIENIEDEQDRRDAALLNVRNNYISKLYNHTGRNVIFYYSAFLNQKGSEVLSINDEDKNGFMLCLHEMDWDKGLDIVLHTPGGDTHATISLIEYLRNKFSNNIRAIIPQIAMSAGTMIACSCKEIVMGKQSSLGPVDPQFGGIAAANLLNEVKKSKVEISNDPNLSLFWNPILSGITPSFLEKCERAISDSNDFFKKSLRINMFDKLSADEQNLQVDRIACVFTNNDGKAHNTHIGITEAKECGLKIIDLEDDDILQDLVLTVHHCYMHTFSLSNVVKIIENQLGRIHQKHIFKN